MTSEEPKVSPRNPIPPEVVEKLMVMLVPKHLALIRMNRAERPELVPWPPAHDLDIAVFSTASYVMGLSNHLILDEMGAKAKPEDLGEMFQ